MLKRTRRHTFYEVWSEDAAESVYVDHEPTTEEVEQLWKEHWPRTSHMPQVFKEKHVYTYADKVTWGRNPKTGKPQILKNGKVIGEQG
jgi:hypothetical protein